MLSRILAGLALSRDTARAMSQENVEAFRRALEAFNHRDFDALLEQLDPEAEWHPGVQASLEGETTSFRGREAFGTGFRGSSTPSLTFASRCRRCATSAIECSRWVGSVHMARKVVSRSSHHGPTWSSTGAARQFGSGPSSIPMRPSKPPGCGTDESQVLWTPTFLSGRVTLGAGDDQLKRRPGADACRAAWLFRDAFKMRAPVSHPHPFPWAFAASRRRAAGRPPRTARRARARGAARALTPPSRTVARAATERRRSARAGAACGG